MLVTITSSIGAPPRGAAGYNVRSIAQFEQWGYKIDLSHPLHSGDHQEAVLYARPSGFRPQDITAEVHLWHGEQNNNVSGLVGHFVADAIPKCLARFFEDEGHFSILYNHIQETLSTPVA